ncbi:MAG: branched-chain amino acid ABC transporter substrate-binding protein [Proteobacteria bacterium]|nr:branched-chain amino acid ABC transporter substrate-binding protein [Pseudomonadota bacterium]
MSAKRLFIGAVAAAGVGLGAAAANANETIKIAYQEPLSGPFANIGTAGLSDFLFVAADINKRGGILGHDIEIVQFDNKLSGQEAIIQLQRAIDQGIRFLLQGQSSGIALALGDAITKNNARNPDNRILHLNYAAVAPALTNEKCSFWHFRFDANVDMKMAALTNYMKTQSDINKIYLINQNYSFGQAVEAAAKKMVPANMPNATIVGAELHPLARIQDFAPYVQKIKASGADTVITGNWGNDLTLLIKAANDAGLDVKWFTYYAGASGTPTAIGKAGVGRVFVINEWHQNVLESAELEEFVNRYEAEYGDEFLFYRSKNTLEMLKLAIEAAGSTDPVKVAFAFEGMKYESELGTVEMRAEDHQLFQKLYVSKWSDNVKYSQEVEGLGFETQGVIESADTRIGTVCKMERPS